MSKKSKPNLAREWERDNSSKKVALLLVDIKTGIFVGIQFAENAHQRKHSCNTERPEMNDTNIKQNKTTKKKPAKEDAKSPQIYLNFEVVFHY